MSTLEIPIQDAGYTRGDKPENGEVFVFHTHGLRQYLGICKMHRTPQCRHLVFWRPGKYLGKTIMRESVNINSIRNQLCKTCWKES